MKISLLSLVPSALLLHCQSVVGAILIQDNFDNVVSGEGVNGRTPDTSLAGGAWQTNTINIKGDGNGALSVASTSNRSIYIDLGADYFSSNPGVYELAMSLDMHRVDSPAWVGIGFTAAAADSTTLSSEANGAQPWIMMRKDGRVNVYAGPSTAGGLNNSPDMPSLSLSTTQGTFHTLSIRLDTSSALWSFRAFLDGAVIDLGTTGNTTYSFEQNPELRYLMIGTSTGGNNVSGASTVDNFLFTGPLPIPEPSSMALVIISGAGLLLRRRVSRGVASR